MAIIMTHAAMVQPIPRLEVVCRVVNDGEIEGEVDCPTFIVELTQEEMDTTLEDDCVIEGVVDQDELEVEIEEGEC